jgi:hypothetical protein
MVLHRKRGGVMSILSIDHTTEHGLKFSSEDILWTVGLCTASLGMAPIVAFYILLVG